jgi:hypothetical protein
VLDITGSFPIMMSAHKDKKIGEFDINVSGIFYDEDTIPTREPPTVASPNQKSRYPTIEGLN